MYSFINDFILVFILAYLQPLSEYKQASPLNPNLHGNSKVQVLCEYE